MPVERPNPVFFHPILPKHPRLHQLFGTKFFKSHRFSDNRKWTPQMKTVQYYHMGNLLQKSNKLKRLEILANRRKLVQHFNVLKQECIDGRQLLKSALLGDQQLVRNILLDNTELQRLYSKMPIPEAVVNIDQRTFVKRRERDRLDYELKLLMNIYKKKLDIKARLTDRIQFEIDFKLNEEFEIFYLQKFIKNSETRLKALQAIQRAYKKMSDILIHDSIYYEPVLNSLESDVEEQANFIEHVIIVGKPTFKKTRVLRKQLKVMQGIAMTQFSDNSKRLGINKKKLFDDSNNVKATVRQYMDRVSKMRVYIRETRSMIDLRQQCEKIERQIKILQTEFLSSSKKGIHLRFKQLENQNKELQKEYQFSEQLMELYDDNVRLAQGKVFELKHDNREEQIKRTQRIEELNDEIDAQKEEQKQTTLKIEKNSDLLMMFTVSLNNIIQILNRYGKKAMTAEKKYPNKVLTLPLLEFGKKMTRVPDKQIEDANVLMTTALEKMEALGVLFNKVGGNERLQRVLQDQLVTKRDGDGGLQEEEKELPKDKGPTVILDDDEKDYPNVHNRKTLKEESAKIVLERSKRQWD